MGNNNWLRQTGAATGVEHEKRIPFGLFESSVIGEVGNFLIGELGFQGRDFYSRHGPFQQKWLHLSLVRLWEINKLAVRVLEDIKVRSE
jgi:hypothetical protein